MSSATQMPKGRFEPPGGCNDNPQPEQPFSSWGYLLPDPTFPGDLSGIPRLVKNTTVDDTSNNAGNTQSQPQFRPLAQLTGVQAGPSAQRKENREYIPQLTAQNIWKPYKGWEDSRHKYVMGSLFPKPLGGWTGSEKDDFKEAVRNFWRGSGDRHDEILRTGGQDQLAYILWDLREQEKREMFNEYAKVFDQLLGKYRDPSGYRLPNLGEGSGNIQVGVVPLSATRDVERGVVSAAGPGHRLRGDASVFEPRGGQNLARGSSALLPGSVPLVNGSELKGPFHKGAGSKR